MLISIGGIEEGRFFTTPMHGHGAAADIAGQAAGQEQAGISNIRGQGHAPEWDSIANGFNTLFIAVVQVGLFGLDQPGNNTVNPDLGRPLNGQ
jgi:hypothetical protein